jgi:hypothetical protein
MESKIIYSKRARQIDYRAQENRPHANYDQLNLPIHLTAHR